MNPGNKGTASAVVTVRREEIKLCMARVEAMDIIPSLKQPLLSALNAALHLLEFVAASYETENDSYALALETVGPLGGVRLRIESISAEDPAAVRTTLQQVITLVEVASDQVGTAIARMPDSTTISQSWRRFELRLRSLLSSAAVDEERFRVESLVRDVQTSHELARDAANAAGATADATIGSQFDTMADAELKQSRFFRQAAFGLAVLAVGLALLLLFLGGADGDDWAAISVRVLAVASLAALAAYSSRIAAQHREVGVWARVVAVQLRSLDAFVISIADQATQDRVREVAAMRMFGAPPSLKAELADSTSVLSALAAQSKHGDAS